MYGDLTMDGMHSFSPPAPSLHEQPGAGYDRYVGRYIGPYPVAHGDKVEPRLPTYSFRWRHGLLLFRDPLRQISVQPRCARHGDVRSYAIASSRYCYVRFTYRDRVDGAASLRVPPARQVVARLLTNTSTTLLPLYHALPA